MEKAGQIDGRIQKLREQMQMRGISIYVVPTSDEHSSEYVGDYYKLREYITGFTGSAGTAVITMDEAGLWTDGRYFVQAEKELKNTQVQLFRMGEPEVPTVTEYVKKHLSQGENIGFDGSCMSAKMAEIFDQIAKTKNGQLFVSEDLVGKIWKERPLLPMEPVWRLDITYAGESTREKIHRIQKKMQEQECDCHLIGSLYDIAWITNLRGSDISHVPVFLSFLYIEEEKVYLYGFYNNWCKEIQTYLQNEGIELRRYEQVYSEVPKLLKQRKKLLLDMDVVNARLFWEIPDEIALCKGKNPSEYMRAVKNKTEISHTIKAHIRDGVAVTRFIYQLKQSDKKEQKNEISQTQVLEELRRQQPGFLDVSFDTICAYGANAAMMHYSASDEQFAWFKPEGFLLVDSGGHYLGGTTDITRTIVLGEVSLEMKERYTQVLQGHLRLANAVFPKGVTGQNLDVLAREPLWSLGLDYRCGTGHGVGHILNVHEGPNAFRWRIGDGNLLQPLLPGMITTDEPGFYQEGAYGIRIENELLCVEGPETEYGQFYQFQNLTYAPIDLEAVLPEKMTSQEREWLNQYHRQVYDTISPYLEEKEKEWLKYETRAI